MKQNSWLQLIIAVLLSSVLFGQLFRFDLFRNSAGGILISDVLAVLAATALFILLATRRLSLPRAPFIKWLGIWAGLLVLSFILGAVHHGKGEDLVGLGYLVRLFSYFSLLLIGYRIFAPMQGTVVRYTAYLLLILLVLGGVILAVLPDFSVLAAQGWDPHHDRLTSTWLDPNYFGTFLAIMFTFFLAWAGTIRQKGRVYFSAYIVFMALLWLGIYLTYSRSALGTLAVGALLVAALISRKTLALIIVLLVVTLALPSRLQERLSETIVRHQSSESSSGGPGSSGTVSSITSIDPSGAARIYSWKRAIQIFQEKPVLGVGYDFYQYSQRDAGLISEAAVDRNRSAAGSDSSLLTLLATTGVLGLLAYLAAWASILGELWRARRLAICLGMAGAVVAWFASSFFNNTLLYAPIMLPVLLLTGVALAAARRTGDHEVA